MRRAIRCSNGEGRLLGRKARSATNPQGSGSKIDRRAASVDNREKVLPRLEKNLERPVLQMWQEEVEASEDGGARAPQGAFNGNWRIPLDDNTELLPLDRRPGKKTSPWDSRTCEGGGSRLQQH